MPQNMQYVDGRMELRTNFNIIHGARGGERMVDSTKKCDKICHIHPISMQS